MELLITLSAIIGFIIGTVVFLNMTDFWLPGPKKLSELEKLTFCPDIEIVKKGNKRAVMLIHEYQGTPESVRYQAESLARAGWDVYAPAMPGSAESREESDKLEPPDFKLWYAYARERYLSLTGRYSHVALVGASIGGSISLKLASESGLRPPAAVVTLASPVRVTGRHFRKRLLRNTMIRMSGVLAVFGGRIETRPLSPEAKEICGFHGIDGILFPKSVHSQKIGLRGVRAALPKVTCPVLCIHAEGDATVGAENLERIASGVKNSPAVVKIRLSIPEDTVSHKHRLAGHRIVRERIARYIEEFLSEWGKG